MGGEKVQIFLISSQINLSVSNYFIGCNFSSNVMAWWWGNIWNVTALCNLTDLPPWVTSNDSLASCNMIMRIWRKTISAPWWWGNLIIPMYLHIKNQEKKTISYIKCFPKRHYCLPIQRMFLNFIYIFNFLRMQATRKVKSINRPSRPSMTKEQKYNTERINWHNI